MALSSIKSFVQLLNLVFLLYTVVWMAAESREEEVRGEIAELLEEEDEPLLAGIVGRPNLSYLYLN